MKIRLEVEYDDGNKTALEFEGPTWRSQIVRFLDFLESPTTPTTNQLITSSPDSIHFDLDLIASEELTIKERLELFLRYEYPKVWFTSLEVKKAYEGVFESINLSTVSTYLSRMYREDILERRGNRSQRQYRIIGDEDILQVPLEEQTHTRI